MIYPIVIYGAQTLRNKSVDITPDYPELKKLIDDGLCFSVATARTAATVADFFEGIPILAGVLMNGTVVFDFQKEEYLVVHKIPENALSDILETLDKYPVSPFIYSVCGKYLNVYHKKLTKEYELSFYEPRKNRRLKKFFEISSFDEIPNGYLEQYG